MISFRKNNVPASKLDRKPSTSILLKEDEKLALLVNEIKNKASFTEKIYRLYTSEFEEKLQNILKMKEMEFMSSITDGVKITMEDLYSLEVHSEKCVKDILSHCEKLTRRILYATNYKLLSTAWSEYETTLQAIKKYSYSNLSNTNKNYKISVKNKESFSFLKNFRKHCRYTEAIAIHSCRDAKDFSKLLEVSADDSKVTHVICIECKQCFLSSEIPLYCLHCKCEYYSSMLRNNENVDFLPATWEKYHCGALVNDSMKCIRCRGIFYINLKTGLLTCCNPVCKFESKPFSIVWTCSLCRSEFKSEAKIYNPLEFKFIKKAITQTLFFKQKARPLNVPCCKVNVYTNRFYHKKECKGELFQGDFNRKMIVVCEKCHAMNFYDRYIWTCPQCGKQFKQNEEEEEIEGKARCSTSIGGHIEIKNLNKQSDPQSQYRNYAKRNPPRARNSKCINISELDMNSNPTSKMNVENIQIHSSANEKQNIPGKITERDHNVHSQCLSTNNSQRRLRHRAKTLFEILEERKSGNQTQSFYSCENNAVLVNKNPVVTDDKEESHMNFDLLKKKYPEKETNSAEEEKKSIVPPNTSREILNQIQFLNDEYAKDIRKIKEFSVDDYSILQQIGEGSYGKIYTILHKQTGKRFALKKIIAHDQTEVDTFNQEFGLVNSFQHSNIMKIFGISSKKLDLTTYAVYVLMELAKSDWDKEVKARFTKKKPYSEDELFNILRQLTEGLSYLQTNSISHRDIKPQNVLVFENEIYKVADFGEAKEVKISKQVNTLRGTELYMSPILFDGLKENLKDVAHNSYKSDVFSLGYCLLYAATLNFNAIYEIRDLRDMKAIARILNKHLKNRYTSKLINLLVKMVEVDEKARFDCISLQKYLSEKN